MNPNAPEHQPVVIRDVVVVRVAAEKVFSEPDEGAVKLINQWVPQYDELFFQRELIDKRNKLFGRHDPLPSYPLFTKTPYPNESNVCTGIRLNIRQALRALDPDAGIPQYCTDAYMEFVCDFANKWHSKLSGIDCRSTGTDPKFYCLDSNFYSWVMGNSAKWVANEFSTYHLDRTQFWKLRYLFIPISFKPKRDAEEPKKHVALCAISPEAKSLEYICSGKDNGLSNSERSQGSRFLPSVFEFLAEFLGDDPQEGFLPYEWKVRTPSGYEQERKRADCGIYTATHTMCLAFGWGIGNEGQFPHDHIARMPSRRRRYVQDLMYGGFKFYEEGADNYQYYPLLDKAPTASASDGFIMLPKEVILGLPKWARNRRACYIDCPGKQMLKLHCKRNARFYPGYNSKKVSGSKVSYRKFLDWVEEKDRMRKMHDYVLGRRPLPYPQFKPARWIDPRDKDPKVIPQGPLWICPYD